MDSSRDVSRGDGVPSANSKPEAAEDLHQVSTTSEDPCESRSGKDTKLSGPVWLAELGKPQTVCIHGMRNNSLDVRETTVGVGHRLKWWFTETELALYDSPHSHYSDWLEICPIVGGRVQITNAHALNIKGRDEDCPLGVAPGSMLQQLMTKDRASRKRE